MKLKRPCAADWGANLVRANCKRWTWVGVAIVLWTLFIWSNSMRNAVDSGQQSGMLYALVEPFLSGLGIGTDLGHTLLRKLAHMTEYAVLGIFWSLQQRKSTCKFSIQGLAVRWQICVLTALLDESIQLFVPGRSGEIRDVWIDGVGAMLGLLAAMIPGCFLRGHRNQVKQR